MLSSVEHEKSFITSGPGWGKLLRENQAEKKGIKDKMNRLTRAMSEVESDQGTGLQLDTCWRLYILMKK